MVDKNSVLRKSEIQLKMAEAISYLMDSLESDVHVEIYSDSCIFRIEGIEKGFVFGNDIDELGCAVETIEYLAPHREVCDE